MFVFIKATSRLLAATLILIGFVGARAQEINLFNGRDLTGWTTKGGPASFQVKDGCIVGKARSSGKGNTFLCTQSEYQDFVLTFEFLADQDINSGVQFRSQVFSKDTRVPGARLGVISAGRVHGYQYEIDTSGRYLTGGIYDEGRRGIWLDGGTTTPSMQAAFKQGGWNLGRIECQGTFLRTYLNGVPVASASDSFTPSGIIAFQIHQANKPGSQVLWRNVKLLPLQPGQVISSATTAATASSPASAQPQAAPAIVKIDPDQPRIEVIKNQGPNALEWALTPLDVTVPADIRENLTLLREDLLDESKTAARSGPEAYRLASDYCDKILIALSQREIARVSAGYSAAQADANMRTSTQALDARRNYTMSWTQYAREESQRAALRESEADKADVKKARLKVEWSQRAERMRTSLDEIYRQLREAMR